MKTEEREMKTEEREKLGKEAGEIARAETLKHCKAVKLTPRRILKRISEGLDAKENKVFYDKDRGRCITGPDMIAHEVRLDAAKMGLSIWGMKAPEKLDVTVTDIGEKLRAARERVNASRKRN